MRSDDLIRALAAKAAPVRVIAPIGRRLALWLSASIIYCAIVIAAFGVRYDLADRLADGRFLLEVAAATATGALAAFAALSSGIPGRAGSEQLLPLVPLGIWLGSLGEGCIESALRIGLDGIALAPDPICFPAISIAGLLPAGMIFLMIRRGAPLAPRRTLALAALASAALGAAAMRLFHVQDASIMVLVWQLGSVAILTAVGSICGRALLRWPTLARLQ